MDAIRLLAVICATTVLGPSAWAQFTPATTQTGRSTPDTAQAGDRGTQVPTRITNTPDFGIPFEISRSSGDVSEVQLHVSTDRGGRWQLYQTLRPDANGFQFRASGDGEYWFAVRTIVRGQDLRRQLQPELKVVVDTQLPKLELRVRHSAGQAAAEWLALDQNLDPSSFRIQYQDQAGQWQDVPFTKTQERDPRTQWQSQTKWWLRHRGPEVAVRAEISDRAGNSKVVNERITIEASAQDGVGFGSQDRVATGRDTSPVGQTWQDLSAGIRNRLPSFFDGVRHSNSAYGAAGPQAWADAEPSMEDFVNRTEQFKTQPTTSPLTPLTTRPISQQFDPNFNRQDLTRTEPPQSRAFDRAGDDRDSVPRYDRESPRVATDRRDFDDPNDRNSLRRSNHRFQEPRQTVGSRVQGPVAQQRSSATKPDNSRERMFRPRITASPNFELVYDLYGVGRDGARQIELWYTRDRGRSWELFGADVDGQSPMEVRLKSQGLYGFQLTVDAGRDQAPLPPQSGDDADVWVVVDWTKPTGQITRVEMPAGVDSREITIEWTAEDTLLADAPITLSYSDNANGPWTPLAKNIPNAGAYYWRVDRRLPERLYIQMEVRDMAGNVSSDIYDGAGGPAGRILDVRPISRQ